MADTRQKADPRSQKIVDVGAMQAARTLTSPQAAQALAADAKARGPAKAIADALRQALQAMVKVAASKGVQIPPDAVQAIAMALAQLLAASMVSAKFAPDPKALVAQVMQLLASAPQQNAPGAPATPPGPSLSAQAAGAPGAPTGMLATAGGA